jgi:hypothetical protein
LARETSADDINLSSPRPAVKGGDIIPDWELRKDSVSLPLKENLSAVRFNLDSTDCGMSEKVTPEDSSPDSCK